jgi:hypothetical protein
MMESALLDELATGDALERAESWRYSRNAVRALAQQAFVAADPNAALTPESRALFEWPQTPSLRLVFVNGVFAPAQSTSGAAGISVTHDADGACAVDIGATSRSRCTSSMSQCRAPCLRAGARRSRCALRKARARR